MNIDWKELLLQMAAGAIYGGAGAIVATGGVSWTLTFWAAIGGAAIKGAASVVVSLFETKDVTNANKYRYEHWTTKAKKIL